MKATAVEEASCNTESSKFCRTRNAASETSSSAVFPRTRLLLWKAAIQVRIL